MTDPAGAETATIQATIDGREVTVPAGTTILTAARDLGIDIPTLCHHETLSPAASCRLCVVEVEGRPNLMPACATELLDGMVLQTESPAVVEARTLILDLLLSDHPMACITCEQSGSCTLQDYCYRYGIEHSSFEGDRRQLPIESDNPMIERDMNKCILCGKCVRVCAEVQVTDAIDFTGRGFESQIAGSFDKPLDTDFCRFCGQCVDVCPTGAIANKQLKGVRTWDRKKVRTTCPFCGVGCNFDLNVAGGKVVGVTAAYDAPANQVTPLRQGPLPHRPHLQPGPHHHPSDQEERRLGESRPGTRPSTWSPRGSQGIRGSKEAGRLRRPQLGALHQRGELAPAEPHEGGDLNTNSIDHCART